MRNLGFLLSVKGKKEVDEKNTAFVEVPKLNGCVCISKQDVEIVEGLVYKLSDNLIHDVDFTKLTNIPNQILKGALNGSVNLEGVKCKYKGYECKIVAFNRDAFVVVIEMNVDIYYMVQ